MNRKPRFRDCFSCWIRERLRTEFILRSRLANRLGLTWRDICNRIDDMRQGPDGISRYVKAPDSSYLHVAEIFPTVGGSILRKALLEYPIHLQRAADVRDSEAPDVSVIIPFSGSDRLPQLQLVLDAFYSQNRASFEIVLVRGDSTELNQLRVNPCVRVIQINEPSGIRFNKSKLFNAGVREARSDSLLLHDADVLVPYNYLDNCISLFDQNWEAFCPIRFLFYLTEAQTAQLRQANKFPRFRNLAEIRQNFAGGSVGISRKAFDAVGGFDESFEGWGGEDVEFLHRARNRRFFEGRLMPALHLWHLPPGEKDPNHPNLFYAERLIAASAGSHLSS